MHPARHLVLIGPMGAGKSSLGRRVAQAHALPFVDLDREIEARAGQDIPALFAAEGEAGFRARERDALADVLAGPACVLASGGGAVLADDNRAAMRRHGFVVYLKIDVEEQLHRLADDTSRPLIAGDDREAVLQRLAAQRAPLYAETAHLVFEPAGLDKDTAAARLTERLHAAWRPAAALATPESK
jgi:shikimate kinase